MSKYWFNQIGKFYMKRWTRHSVVSFWFVYLSFILWQVVLVKNRQWFACRNCYWYCRNTIQYLYVRPACISRCNSSWAMSPCSPIVVRTIAWWKNLYLLCGLRLWGWIDHFPTILEMFSIYSIPFYWYWYLCNLDNFNRQLLN